ncbi:hypothetical protein [Streptosporangium pseudovulgare]|uniref:Uncharacterized protein n=1 Tax=Streptosporangium pseudovulgare TaxID=35765 RepID=A0ABQ2R6E9_9ACTN|nr:hypothetical protein [Streptosporangium pseudovulgare]GGQ11192.1 hypothetical protein GCM10010140_46680 [Streptosporangium pseudovulgare]
MTSVAGQSANKRFAQANIRVALSDHLKDFDCLLFWFFESNRDYVTGLIRPFKRSDLMDVFGVSKDIVKRSLARLRASGWVSFEDLGHEGQRPILHDWPSAEDTFHGIEDTKFAPYLEGKGWARLPREIMTSGASPRAIRIWVILMIIKGHDKNRPESYGWAYITRAELAAFIRYPGTKLHPKTTQPDTDQLEEFGLVEIDEHAVHGRTNRYRPTAKIRTPVAEVEPQAKQEAAAKVVEPVMSDRDLASWEHISICLTLAGRWINGMLGRDQLEFVNELEEQHDASFNAVEKALEKMNDPEVIRIRLDTALEAYGPSHSFDLISKVLDFDADPLSEEELAKLQACSDSRTHR